MGNGLTPHRFMCGMDLAKELYQDSVYSNWARMRQILIWSRATSDLTSIRSSRLLGQPVYGWAFVADHPTLGTIDPDTIPGQVVSRTSRVNFTTSPLSPSRLFRINDQPSLVTTAYASFGTGGGMRLDGVPRFKMPISSWVEVKLIISDSTTPTKAFSKMFT